MAVCQNKPLLLHQTTKDSKLKIVLKIFFIKLVHLVTLFLCFVTVIGDAYDLQVNLGIKLVNYELILLFIENNPTSLQFVITFFIFFNSVILSTLNKFSNCKSLEAVICVFTFASQILHLPLLEKTLIKYDIHFFKPILSLIIFILSSFVLIFTNSQLLQPESQISIIKEKDKLIQEVGYSKNDKLDFTIQKKIEYLSLEDDGPNFDILSHNQSIKQLHIYSDFDQSSISSKVCYKTLSNNGWITTGQFWSIKTYGEFQTDDIYTSYSAAWTDLSSPTRKSQLFNNVDYFQDSNYSDYKWVQGIKIRPSKLNVLQLTHK
jgi:hypothetical protein